MKKPTKRQKKVARTKFVTIIAIVVFLILFLGMSWKVEINNFNCEQENLYYRDLFTETDLRLNATFIAVEIMLYDLQDLIQIKYNLTNDEFEERKDVILGYKTGIGNFEVQRARTGGGPLTEEEYLEATE